jgi:hypothetical protein
MNDKIRGLLAALGGDPAAKLRELGIRGIPVSGDACPIAVYLTQSDVPVLCVSPYYVDYPGSCYKLLWNGEDRAVVDFICDFDNGRYPELRA